MLLETSIQVYPKPLWLQFDKYSQIYIHYSKRKHTQKLTPGRGKMLKLSKSVQNFQKIIL